MNKNYIYDVDHGIWMRPGFSGISYSDGDEIEARIAQILNNVQDLSLLSPELKAQSTDWVTTYHFSSSRANVLRPFEDRLRSAEVLEIGAGCGAITRYLGEIGANILALEGSMRRARIARARTRDLANVRILLEDFKAFETDKRFDVVTLIGVLEYANLFFNSVDPAVELLEKVRSLLKPDGQLILALENQLGLKYFSGAAEDHIGIAYYGIEGQYTNKQAQTFGRQELKRKLVEAGFHGHQELLPFPDYKFPTTVLNNTALSAVDFDAAAFASMSAAIDPQKARFPAFSQELVWPELMKCGLGLDFSNSFLWIASPTEKRQNPHEPLTWHFSVGRKPEFSKVTTFERKASGNIAVKVKKLVNTEGGVDFGGFKFEPIRESTYLNLPTLNQEFSRIAARPVFDLDEVVSYVRRYLDFLNQIAVREGFFSDSEDFSGGEHQDFPGVFLDAVPQNILLAEDGTAIYFDREWVSKAALPVRYMVFRTLTTLLDRVTLIGSPSLTAVRSFDDLLSHVLNALGLPYTHEHREQFIDLEAQLCNGVFGDEATQAIRQRLEAELPIRPSIASLVDELNTVKAMQHENEMLRQSITKLLRSPLVPLRNSVHYYVARRLSKLLEKAKPVMARKLAKSAAKRNPRRFHLPDSGNSHLLV